MILLAGALLCLAAAGTPSIPVASPDSGATAAPPGAASVAVAETTAAAAPDSLVVQLDRLAAHREQLGETDLTCSATGTDG